MGKKIVALGASSSKNSINKVLATYAAGIVENGDVEVLDLNDYQLPLYSIDLEMESGIPDMAKTLLDDIQSADGLVISFAEHNGAYSAAFKNAFDWMSRIDGKLWADIPMVLLATSPGARGGATVLEIAKGRFPYMGGNIVGSLPVPSWGENFKDGLIINSDIQTELENIMSKL